VIQDVFHASPLRVGLASGSLTLGGVTIFLCNLGGELVRRKIPVEVMNFELDNPLAADFQRLNVPVRCQDHHRLIFEDRLAAVLRELSRFQPTVVLANLSSTSFEVLRYLPAGVFRVGVGHSDHPTTYEMMRHYAPHMDLLAVVSETMKRKAGAMPDFSRLPVACLRHGVPIPPDERLAARRFDRPLRILYLGRLVQEQKRVRLFPAILEGLKSSGIPFHWTIAGEGPEREFLERTMSGAPPQQTISFPGKILYVDVPRILSEHDVFLLASDHEGLPLSLLEAMGQALVPVVSDLPSGIPEVVDAASGMPVPVDDVEGYARAIIHLHDHREELAAKSAAARERVKKDFSVGAMTDRWLAAFPTTTAPISVWPKQWSITAPLTARHPIYFSPPVRTLRRMAARLRLK
jgi:glycosyltransferase involved in cell wall biosynthesis